MHQRQHKASALGLTAPARRPELKQSPARTLEDSQASQCVTVGEGNLSIYCPDSQCLRLGWALPPTRLM